LAYALVGNGFELMIYNRTLERAEELAAAVGAFATACIDPSGCSLVVNATSASKSGERLAIDWSRAPKSAVAYDLFYSKSPTPFLSAAAEAGLVIQDGLKVLVAQGALSFEWWLDVAPPRDVMEAAAREAM
jgi:shikimate dehydrogenase